MLNRESRGGSKVGKFLREDCYYFSFVHILVTYWIFPKDEYMSLAEEVLQSLPVELMMSCVVCEVFFHSAYDLIF
jgi:hypothetical protein